MTIRLVVHLLSLLVRLVCVHLALFVLIEGLIAPVTGTLPTFRKGSTLHALLNNALPAVEASPLIETTHALSFDLSTATILAGYAFEAYNEPEVRKRAVGSDGTCVVFTSSEFIQSCFEGVLLVGAVNCTLKPAQAEQPLLDQLATGALPDPFLRLTVLDGPGDGRVEDRVIDEWTSDVRPNTLAPAWRDLRFLYIR